MNLSNGIFRGVVYFMLVIIFLVLGFFVVTYAAGYSIDFKNREISQTGLISIQTSTDGAQIFMNSKEVGTNNLTMRNLEPDNYKIEVKKDGFFSWSEDVDLKAQEALSLGNIILFKKNPQIEEYETGGISVRNIETLSDQDDLSAQGGEIIRNGNLITRFSSDVYGLSWYPGHGYISFTTGSKLCLMSSDGTNLVEIVDKGSKSTAVFTNSGKYVVFENQGKIYRTQIR